MTDIVERLLLKKTLETVEDVHVLFADAADEIERLRATLDQTRRFALSGEMDTVVSDEIERLREENTYLQQIIKEYQRAMGFDEECSIALGEKE